MTTAMRFLVLLSCAQPFANGILREVDSRGNILKYADSTHVKKDRIVRDQGRQIVAKVDWKLCNSAGSNVPVVSNLAGQGPDKAAKHELRYSGVATVSGVNVDLVVKVAKGSNYSAWNQEQNKNPAGATGSCLGYIPLKVGTNTEFDFAFMRTGTDVIVAVDQFDMSIFDFDSEKINWWGGHDEHEYVVFKTPIHELEKGSEVRRVDLSDNSVRFESIATGKDLDNPVGLPITAGQMAKSVSVSYTKPTDGIWKITFGHENGNWVRDRKFYFAGANPAFVDWKLCDMAGANVPVVSNLAGQGPDKAAKHELRFSEVATVNGMKVDLVAKVASDSEYKAWNQEENKNPAGVMGKCIGYIPLKVRTHTKLDFAFMQTGTENVIEVEHFDFSVLDFDSEKINWEHGEGDEHEYVVFNTKVNNLRKGDQVRIADSDGSVRAESISTGKDSDNPTGLPFNDGQLAKSVSVSYTKPSSGVWTVTFGHENGNTIRDRKYYFVGCFGDRCH